MDRLRLPEEATQSEIVPEKSGIERTYKLVDIKDHAPDKPLPPSIKGLECKQMVQIDDEDKRVVISYAQTRIDYMAKEVPQLLQEFPGFTSQDKTIKPSVTEVMAMAQQIMARYTGVHQENIGAPHNLRGFLGDSENPLERPFTKCNHYNTGFAGVFKILCEEYNPEILNYYVLGAVHASAAVDLSHAELQSTPQRENFRRTLLHCYLNLISMDGDDVRATPVDPYWVYESDGLKMTRQDAEKWQRLEFRRADALLNIAVSNDPTIIHRMIMQDAEIESTSQGNLYHAIHLHSIIEQRINEPLSRSKNAFDSILNAREDLHSSYDEELESINQQRESQVDLLKESFPDQDGKPNPLIGTLTQYFDEQIVYYTGLKTRSFQEIAETEAAFLQWENMHQDYSNHRDALVIRAVEQIIPGQMKEDEMLPLISIEHMMAEYGGSVSPKVYVALIDVMRAQLDGIMRLQTATLAGYRIGVRSNNDAFILPMYDDPALVGIAYEFRVLEYAYYAKSNVYGWIDRFPKMASVADTQKEAYMQFLGNLVNQLNAQGASKEKIAILQAML